MTAAAVSGDVELADVLSWYAGAAAELEASVHMPRIGCGLAGGTWARIEPLIERRLISAGTAVTVYDHG